MSNSKWPRGTRYKNGSLGARQKTAGAQVITWDLPRTGILESVYVACTMTVAGSLSAPNPLGLASIISRVRLIANSNLDLVNITGASLFYALPDILDLRNTNTFPASNNARAAVTATTARLNFWLPLAISARDPIGLINLQNMNTQLQLSIEFNADALVATGATVTGTVEPVVNLFTMPVDPENRPDFLWAVTTRDEQQQVAGAGTVNFEWQIGNQYATVVHLFGAGAAGADNWSSAILRINLGDNILSYTPATMDIAFERFHNRPRALGSIHYDLLATSGLGDYGSYRDVIDSRALTSIQSVLTLTAAGTLTTLRREIIPFAQ